MEITHVLYLFSLIATHLLKIVIILLLLVPEHLEQCLEYSRQAIQVCWNTKLNLGYKIEEENEASRCYIIFLFPFNKTWNGVFIWIWVFLHFLFLLKVNYPTLQSDFTPIVLLKATNNFQAVKSSGHEGVCSADVITPSSWRPHLTTLLQHCTSLTSLVSFTTVCK